MPRTYAEPYRSPLRDGVTLAVYDGERCIFESKGKWLHPLFELEKFLAEREERPADLSAHDTAVGKAAAVLMARLGIRRIHGNLMSRLAAGYLSQEHPHVEVSYTHLVDKLLCATEEQLENLHESDDMYYLLRQRAKLTQGVSVQVDGLCHPHGFISGLSFSLAPGGRLIIEGENGAGKTTLLSLLAGLEKPASGNILIGGKPSGKTERGTIGYIPQHADTSKFPLSVEEVVSIGIPPGTGERKKEILRALERTSSGHLAGRDFASLSGGEKQKVSMARCLAQHAKLLLLDEPTAALDAENRKMVMDILRSLSVTEIPTIIIVTHDAELSSLSGWQKLTLGGS